MANVKSGGAGMVLTLYALTNNWKNYSINEKKITVRKTNLLSHRVAELDILKCQATGSMESSLSGKICKNCLRLKQFSKSN